MRGWFGGRLHGWMWEGEGEVEVSFGLCWWGKWKGTWKWKFGVV